MVPFERTARVRRRALDSPARFVTAAFLAAIAAGTALLLLPAASAGDGGASFGTAAFTATSAVTVTGLALVDTAGHWSAFGEAVILGLIQLGGIGIMTLASLVMLALSRRIGLRHRLFTQVETGVHALRDVRNVVRGVLVVSAVTETVIAVVLSLRFWLAYDEPFGSAVWNGVFHAVSAFNNAGFALFADNLVGFATDPVITLSIAAAVVVGGLGVPVLVELAGDGFRWHRWSLHTKLVLSATAVLIVAGWCLVAAFEWSNPHSLGPMSATEKLLTSLVQGVAPRTAGFNTVDYHALNETTWAVTIALMFIGAGPASTGGGIKVTTFALLAFVILTEVRGDPEVTIFRRRTPPTAERQAVSIALVGIGVVAVCTLALMAMGDWGLTPALFETTSAFGTVGLSTGITSEIPTPGQVLLGALMLAGRVGPLTVGAALALRRGDRRLRYAEERPLIG